MNEFLTKMISKAKEKPQRIAFAESQSQNILKTAEAVVKEQIGYPMLVDNPEEIAKTCAEYGISTEGFSYFDNTSEEARKQLAADYVSKFDDISEKSVMRKAKEPLRCAMLLLKVGRVDCTAAGKEYSTGDVVYEAMSIVGMQEGVESASSLGIADIPGFQYGEHGMLGLADCAITAMPDANDLAGIAISSADTASKLLGWTPRVAMLSFSTDGSAEHESIDVIRNAVEIVHEKRPDLDCDGEFQLDAAIIPEVAEHKVHRESKVAGKANILIFPNLHAGNIGVKLIQIFGHANAYGPVLQGFAKPVCDFSRSAPVEEMLGNVAMLIIRAAQ